ncbi:MAG: dTMP kinase [Pseudomonadota bacterium]
MTRPRGVFITLEGGEGAGKSTLIERLGRALSRAGLAVRQTREPGGTPLAQRVRELVLNPGDGLSWSPLAEALLMNAARADHLETLIRPALEAGAWVLCDRFMDSTRAYQAAGGASAAFLEDLERQVVGDTPPDLTLVLDAAPEALLARRDARGGTDAFEARSLAFHEEVRRAFLDIARQAPDRCVVIDAAQDADAVFQAAWTAIEARFELADAAP